MPSEVNPPQTTRTSLPRDIHLNCPPYCRISSVREGFTSRAVRNPAAVGRIPSCLRAGCPGWVT